MADRHWMCRMPENQKPVCKICQGSTDAVGTVDFNQSCIRDGSVSLPVAGIAVPYWHCRACGFLFSDYCDGWTTDRFEAEIYNADYRLVDPDYDELRPAGSASVILEMFGHARHGIRVLDYGAGSGRMAEIARGNGFNIESWDPFSSHQTERPQGLFDLVVCNEVLEHTADPVATARDIVEWMPPHGVVYISTQIQEFDNNTVDLDWWYIGPRNGHISIFSQKSLSILWEKVERRCFSFNRGVHLAVGLLPEFVRPYFTIK
jgi:hypothetical protein